jgi:hypothetical protein
MKSFKLYDRSNQGSIAADDLAHGLDKLGLLYDGKVRSEDGIVETYTVPVTRVGLGIQCP